jgi:preprotein translocase subunit SecE
VAARVYPRGQVLQVRDLAHQVERSHSIVADVKADNRVVHYFKETRAELKKVNWPTRKEAQNLTLIVLAVTVFMAALLWVFDQLSSALFRGVLVQRDTLSIIIAVALAVIGLIVLVITLRRQ